LVQNNKKSQKIPWFDPTVQRSPSIFQVRYGASFAPKQLQQIHAAAQRSAFPASFVRRVSAATTKSGAKSSGGAAMGSLAPWD
jgi:hypothetical protein